MKKFIAFFVFILSAFLLHAQVALNNKNTDESIKNGAVTLTPVNDGLLLKETEFDFGKIPQGKPVTHVFDVVNNSNDSLKIINVQASCGCTTPDWDRNKVQAPAGQTKITVGYNAASDGPFTKTITITYNGTKTKQITIKGEVWKTPASSVPENKELANLKDL